MPFVELDRRAIPIAFYTGKSFAIIAKSHCFVQNSDALLIDKKLNST